MQLAPYVTNQLKTQQNIELSDKVVKAVIQETVSSINHLVLNESKTIVLRQFGVFRKKTVAPRTGRIGNRDYTSAGCDKLAFRTNHKN